MGSERFARTGNRGRPKRSVSHQLLRLQGMPTHRIAEGQRLRLPSYRYPFHRLLMTRQSQGLPWQQNYYHLPLSTLPFLLWHLVLRAGERGGSLNDRAFRVTEKLAVYKTLGRGQVVRNNCSYDTPRGGRHLEEFISHCFCCLLVLLLELPTLDTCQSRLHCTSCYKRRWSPCIVVWFGLGQG